MSNPTFAQLFQSRVTGENSVLYSLDELEMAMEESCTSQVDINPVAVKKIVTSLAATKWLIRTPILGTVPSERIESLIGGRHRITAIEEICANYGLSPTGKIQLRTEKNATELTDIEPIVAVNVLTFSSKADLAAYVEADNRSRAVTQFEVQLLKEYSATQTPLARLQMGIVDKLRKGFTDNVSEMPLEMPTDQTFFAMVKASFTALGKDAKYMTEDQQQLLVNLLVESALNNGDAIDKNLARQGYKDIVNLALKTEYVGEDASDVVDAAGETITHVYGDDSDSYEGNCTVAEWLTASLAPPAKAPKVKRSKVSDLQAQVEALQAKLAELNVSA